MEEGVACTFYPFQLPDLSVQNIDPDELRCMRLGTRMCLSGPVLYLRCVHVLGASPAENMSVVWKGITDSWEFLQRQEATGELSEAEGPMR